MYQELGVGPMLSVRIYTELLLLYCVRIYLVATVENDGQVDS